jgi:hypothetical protein
MATYMVNCIWIILGFKRKRPILVIVDTTFSNQWVCRSWLGQPISCVELNSWLIWVDFQITSWFRVYNSEITWNQNESIFLIHSHFIKLQTSSTKKIIFYYCIQGLSVITTSCMAVLSQKNISASTRCL